jgi:hypothetical protein
LKCREQAVFLVVRCLACEAVVSRGTHVVESLLVLHCIAIDQGDDREWARIDTNNCLSFAFIRVHLRLILLARGCGPAALCNLRNFTPEDFGAVDHFFFGIWV